MPAAARILEALPVPLPRNPANDAGGSVPVCIRNDQRVSPPLAIETSERESPVSYPPNPKTLRERIAEALRRRMNGTGLTAKHLARAMNVSAGTIDNLLSGNNDPSARVLLELVRFFDSAFCNEVFAGTGATIVKLSDQRALAAARKIAEGVEELKALEGRG